MKRKVAHLTTTLLLMVFLVAVGVMPVYATAVPSPARTVVTTLPDANAPDAPAVVTLQDENGDQTIYVREEDPENEGEYTYVPEEEVPLSDLDGEDNAVQDTSGQKPASNSPVVNIIAVVGTVCVLGMAVFFILAKKRK